MILQLPFSQKSNNSQLFNFIKIVAIYEKYSDVSEKDAAEFALCYSEAVRNRDYQDYGRNNGGRLWS